MNILAIGNSFTQDGVRYLRKISQNQNNDMLIVSLVIGGCSLADHFRNMKADNKCYQMEFNGEWTGFFMGIKEVMLGRKWDVVTIQQVHGLYQGILSRRKDLPAADLVL